MAIMHELTYPGGRYVRNFISSAQWPAAWRHLRNQIPTAESAQANGPIAMRIYEILSFGEANVTRANGSPTGEVTDADTRDATSSLMFKYDVGMEMPPATDPVFTPQEQDGFAGAIPPVAERHLRQKFDPA